jgi:hypothetical protein
MDTNLLVALVQIIQHFEGIACTLIGPLESGGSFYCLMMDVGIEMLPTTQGERQWRITYHLLGSSQALADAVQWNQHSPQVLKVHSLPDDFLRFTFSLG